MTDDSQNADPRIGSITRTTTETHIEASIALDGTGLASIATGIGFFDHMLEQLARHSLMDITVNATGDLHIDSHHTVEDCGWALGAALSEALGSRQGIRRYGWCMLPMDEVLSRAAVDISGRPFLVWRVNLPAQTLGTMNTEVFREFFQAFAQAAGITVHINTLYGTNTHHIIESCFKALARSMREAVAHAPREEGRVPSTKGVLGGDAGHNS